LLHTSVLRVRRITRLLLTVSLLTLVRSTNSTLDQSKLLHVVYEVVRGPERARLRRRARKRNSVLRAGRATQERGT